MLNTTTSAPTIEQELLQALLLAIRAMNNARSFDTGILKSEGSSRTLSSYELLPKLEAVVRKAGGQP